MNFRKKPFLEFNIYNKKKKTMMTEKEIYDSIKKWTRKISKYITRNEIEDFCNDMYIKIIEDIENERIIEISDAIIYTYVHYQIFNVSQQNKKYNNLFDYQTDIEKIEYTEYDDTEYFNELKDITNNLKSMLTLLEQNYLERYLKSTTHRNIQDFCLQNEIDYRYFTKIAYKLRLFNQIKNGKYNKNLVNKNEIEVVNKIMKGEKEIDVSYRRLKDIVK